MGNCLHLHTEDDIRPFVKAFRHNLNLAIVSAHDSLAYGEPQTYTLLIEILGVFKLAETMEESLLVFVLDALPSVLHVHYQHLVDEVERSLYTDRATCRELQRVLD